MIEKFIDRPVLSTVITITIIFLGVLGLLSLPVTTYPDIAPPTIKVRTNYIGSNAETVLKSVVVPIEEEINGVEGMTYIESRADNGGNAEITVYFEQGTDPDIASVNVQNRVSLAIPKLPQEVVRSGVVTRKQQTSALMFISFYSKSETYDETFIQNYMNINIISGIKRISGVGDARAFGVKNYSMRVWLSPEKLAQYDLVPQDIVAVINEQSIEAAPGKIGMNTGAATQYVLKYQGRFDEVKEYENIIVKATDQGEILRLSDVAKVELGAFTAGTIGETNGNPSVTMGIYQTPGSNAQVIIEEVKEYLEEQEANFPPGVDYLINFDSNEFLEASMENVLHTLYEAFILVFIVVFIFLQDFRSTIIPAIAVPVSIVGALFFLLVLDYSLNLLTLFAMILAIGIVVDDAIVVVEAVHAKMAKKPEMDVKTATKEAMSGIVSAVISATLVMIAVFIPVTFIAGPTGVFFKQFGITLMCAIFISAINALTLSPMLCALILKHHHEPEKKNFLQRFYDAFNVAFEKFTEKYGSIVSFLIGHKIFVLGILLLSIFGIWWANNSMPTGFVPGEDKKVVFANIELPPGATLDRTYLVLKQLEEQANKIPGVVNSTVIGGVSLINGVGNNYGVAFLQLEDWETRLEHDDQSVEAIIGKLFGISQGMPDARMIFFSPPSVPGFGVSSGFEFKLLDRTGGDQQELERVTRDFLSKLMDHPEVQYAITAFNTNYPMYEMIINEEAIKSNGVKVSDVFQTVGGYVGGIYAANFTRFGKQFRVMIQASADERADLRSLNDINVRNANGDMLPVNQFITFKQVYGPQSVSRFNLFNSAAVNGAPSQGYSSGDVIALIDQMEKTELPLNYSIDYSGLTLEEIKSAGQTTVIFIITFLFVYLLLSAQYESYLLPWSILLAVPIGVMGAFVSQKLAGLQNNIFFQIALVMLIGLIAKNAILIVEFGLQQRKKGMGIAEAAIQGAKDRLRPILMTSFAFVVGVMPLVLASGIGANGNRSLATGAAFGLLVGTLIGGLVIPALFVVFQTLQEKIKPMEFDKNSNEELNE
ncbi:efflux RND transporter permease subunit [Marinigracilibium pacificum]|uniref:Efflux RND transporter permease subunit n=1 Tax=Marinigracilibium pacificum TaxID=2729599 RepID=A0A848IXA8_9BACT|nr:efflux RND transporter permease subunit [Marinigracilibium pacificum]NMM48286.1 efflux RND transporter permease subunit [Marinigracilibium pacificum]